VSTLPEGKEIASKTTYSIRRGESCSSYHRKLKSNREANLSWFPCRNIHRFSLAHNPTWLVLSQVYS